MSDKNLEALCRGLTLGDFPSLPPIDWSINGPQFMREIHQILVASDYPSLWDWLVELDKGVAAPNSSELAEALMLELSYWGRDDLYEDFLNWFCEPMPKELRDRRATSNGCTSPYILSAITEPGNH